MKKKAFRAFALLFCALLAFGAAACGGDPGTENGGEKKGLVDYEAYKDTLRVEISAWGFPLMYDAENNTYDTPENRERAREMREAGITTVNLAGRNNMYPGSYLGGNPTAEEVVAHDKTLADIFHDNGMKSVVFTSNLGRKTVHWDFDSVGMPDFTGTEGFSGLMVWDEPVPEGMATLARYADLFEQIYKDTDVTFMVNLFPSYSDLFATGGFGAYLQSYCETVLSRVSGNKFLSLDTYPIRTDGDLDVTQLYDIAMLTHYAREYDAEAHLVLQSAQTASKRRTPELGELSMQAYAALAFGADSLSWYTYITAEEQGFGDNTAPVDQNGKKNETYAALAKVNNDIAAFGYAYRCFDWKGIMMNPVTTKSSMNLVLKDRFFASELLTYDDLNMLAGAESEQDYLLGAFEDANGNEGFLLSNYCAKNDASDVSVDLEFKDADTLMIWQGGEKKLLPLSDGKITIDLSFGEGVFMIPYAA